jgi:hypothetical protein
VRWRNEGVFVSSSYTAIGMFIFRKYELGPHVCMYRLAELVLFTLLASRRWHESATYGTLRN